MSSEVPPDRLAQTLPPSCVWDVAAAIGSGDLTAAEAEVAELPEAHPAHAGALAVIDLMAGNSRDAALALQGLAESHGADVCVANTATLALWAAGMRDAASSMLLEARGQDPTDGRLAFLSWFLEVEPPADLTSALDAGLNDLPDHLGLQLARGVVELEVGDPAAAVPRLEAAQAGGVMEAEGPLLQAYYYAGQRGPYLRAASRLNLPLGDRGAIATAEDPEAAYAELLGVPAQGSLMAELHTSLGELRCELLTEEAPVTVANFVGLARGGLPWRDPASGDVVDRPLYDGTVFHRVIPEFMVQGGDPLGSGGGGPGYTFVDEVTPELRFDRPGLLAMANRGPHTNGSQFFVTEVATPHLDGRHTIFGKCDEASIEVVRQMARVPLNGERPEEPITLESVTIVAQ